jgi:hypothetical protein
MGTAGRNAPLLKILRGARSVEARRRRRIRRRRPVDAAHARYGMYRLNLRSGVNCLRSGYSHTVGIIFHDAT